MLNGPTAWPTEARFDKPGITADEVDAYITRADTACNFSSSALVWFIERCMYVAALNRLAFIARSFGLLGFLMMMVFMPMYCAASRRPAWCGCLAFCGGALFIVCGIIRNKCERFSSAMRVYHMSADMGPWRKDMQP